MLPNLIFVNNVFERYLSTTLNGRKPSKQKSNVEVLAVEGADHPLSLANEYSKAGSLEADGDWEEFEDSARALSTKRGTVRLPLLTRLRRPIGG